MVTFHIITLFPESFSYLNQSVLGKAQKKKISVVLYNLRDFRGERGTTDDKPYGGGPGMVMKAEPILRAVRYARGRKKSVKVIILDAGGAQFTNTHARKLADEYRHIILVAGRYEGIDERVYTVLRRTLGKGAVQKMSIGPYVLSGGELPAMVVVDAVARHVPGVLGKKESLEETRTASSEVYTRPEVLRDKGRSYRVPPVLSSGDHKKIEAWRGQRAKNSKRQ